eukprot:TRINITY_DN21535_c0_g3_i1.p1 TRINITY_DN21535_c0_g3~~TRINITY_DN21535_c0_g3_i1.p1  ORF type:complete len:1450 (+),score=316.72 TRINITY_DN21535_c0_g3_i1:1229-5578(+)
MWQRVRQADARIVVHEHGGNSFEFFLLLSNDLLGEKTFYMQVGHSCGSIDFFDMIAWAQADYRALDSARSFTQCTACPNIAKYFLGDKELQNFTYLTEWLYTSANPYLSVQAAWCPQFPDNATFAACEYCDGMKGYFASPECDVLGARFSSMMLNSICIEPDFSGDIGIKESIQNYIDCAGPDVCHGPNLTSGGHVAVQNLLRAGVPMSYLQDYEPGGRMYNKGQATSLGTPATYSRMWTDVSLCDAMGVNCWVNTMPGELVDLVLTAIVAFNDFVRHGGDADATSSATRLPVSDGEGNAVAYGWKRFLLDAEFNGFLGPVQYLPSGERNVVYRVLQIVAGNTDGCFASFANSSSSQQVRHVSAFWNFVSVPLGADVTGDLAVDPTGSNDLGCDPFPPGTFAGKIAFIRRGACYFGTKVMMAQRAGAIGMVVLNAYSDLPVFMSADDQAIKIPSVAIGLLDGTPWWNLLKGGGSVKVTLQGSTQCLDPSFAVTGGLQIYALKMNYDMKTNKLTLNNGTEVACSGKPGEAGAHCRGISFNDGSSVPPRATAEQCTVGYEFSHDLRECVACPEGRFLRNHNESERCLPCDAGRFAPLKASTECERCPRGSFSELASAKCTLCSPGTYSDSVASPVCIPCAMGRFSNFLGTNESCYPCEQGSYSDVPGLSRCHICNGSMTTPGFGHQFRTDCVCARETYRPEGDTVGACLPCPKGMECRIGSDMENWRRAEGVGIVAEEFAGLSQKQREKKYGTMPELLPKYMSRRENPLWVFECLSEQHCPGGIPESCGENMHGLTCAQCADGYYRSGAHCIQCTALETSQFLFPFMPLTLAPLVISVMYIKMQDGVEKWGSPMNGFMVCAFIILQHAQALAILSVFNLVYPMVVGVTWGSMTFFMEGLSILRISCAGFRSFAMRFTTNMLVPVIVAIFFFMTLGINRLITMCCGTRNAVTDADVFQALPFFPKLKHAITHPMDKNLLFNCFGTTMFSFSVSVAAISLSLFKFYTHPNGIDRSIFSASDVLVASPEWNSMVVVALLAVLVYCVATFALTSWILYVAPRRFANVVFRRRWKFLLAKFRPEVWWWANVVVLKGILLNVSLVVFEAGLEQIWGALVIQILYVSVVIFARPWRHVYAVFVDSVSTVSLVATTGLTAWFAPRDTINVFHGAGLISITMLPLLPFLWYGIRAPYKYLNAVKVNSEALTFGYEFREIFERFNSISVSEVQRFMMRLTEHDRNALRGAKAVLMAEMFQKQMSDNVISRSFLQAGSTVRLISEPERTGAHADWHPRASVGQKDELGVVTVQAFKQKVLDSKQRSDCWTPLFSAGYMGASAFEAAALSDLNLSKEQAASLFQLLDLRGSGTATLENVASVCEAMAPLGVSYGSLEALRERSAPADASKKDVLDVSKAVPPDFEALVTPEMWDALEETMADETLPTVSKCTGGQPSRGSTAR